jgi:hypothetical protein
MNRQAAEPPSLTYDGTEYRLRPDAVANLLTRGVIVATEPGGSRYELAVEHTIDELEDAVEVVARPDASRRSRLHVIRRNAGFSTGRSGFWNPRRDSISIEDEPRDQ